MSEKRPFVPKTPVDFQKLKLDRLMANPDKPVIIPETTREKKGFSVPEFVRNVMGSSAGAGSGEFHVYRHLRRKEYTRQKMIEEKAGIEKLDEEFEKKLEDNKRKREERIAKNRAKRLKKKERKKRLAKKPKKLDAKLESEESSLEGESDECLDEHSSANDCEQIAECNTSNFEKEQKKLDVKVESLESSLGNKSDESLDKDLDHKNSSANDSEQVSEPNTSNIEKNTVVDTT